MESSSEGRRVPGLTVKNEVNITTVIALVSCVCMLGGLLWAWSGNTTKVNEWIAAHDELHKQRFADTTSSNARIDERLKKLEEEARTLENLRYRLTVQEQGAASLTRAVDELRQALAAQSSDIRLIREIVTRLDPGPQDKRRP